MGDVPARSLTGVRRVCVRARAREHTLKHSAIRITGKRLVPW